MKHPSENKPTFQDVESSIKKRISTHCMIPVEKLDVLAPLGNIDLDSILAMTIIEELQQEYEVDLPIFLFFKYETIRECAKAIVSCIETDDK
jgi:acyl carrier protein